MKSRCFYVEYDYIVLDFYIVTSVNNCVSVIYKVCLKTINHLEVGIVLVYLLNGIHSLRICLCVAVVGYSYRLVTPCVSLLYKH